MVKLIKNKTFRKKKLYRNRNKNNTKKMVKGGSNTEYTNLKEKLQEILKIKPTPKIKIEIINNNQPENTLTLYKQVYDQSRTTCKIDKYTPPRTIPNIIEISNYKFDYYENSVKIIVKSEISKLWTLLYTYTIIFDKSKNTITDINIELEFQHTINSGIRMKYGKKFNSDKDNYQIKIYYLKEITEEFLEELSKSELFKEKNVNEDLQKTIFNFLDNKDWVNII